MDDYSRSQNNAAPTLPNEAEIARLVEAAINVIAHHGGYSEQWDRLRSALALPCFSQYRDAIHKEKP